MNKELRQIHRDFAKVTWVLRLEKILQDYFSLDFLNEYVLERGASEDWHIDDLIASYHQLANQYKIALPSLSQVEKELNDAHL